MSGFWQDDAGATVYRVPDDVQDLVFRIECRTLPVDHAAALNAALLAELPWLAGEDHAGIHLIHGAESGNGWQRPDDDGVLHLSRRARMSLRLPRERVDAARELSGRSLELGGYRLRVGAASVRPLSDLTTLFARYLVSDVAHADESEFLQWASEALAAVGVRARKMLAGRVHRLRWPDGERETRSLMLAGLEVPDSVRLQQLGLGDGRLFGCGLFLPHKSIEAVEGARHARPPT